jgi:hypothetical protein
LVTIAEELHAIATILDVRDGVMEEAAVSLALPPDGLALLGFTAVAAGLWWWLG